MLQLHMSFCPLDYEYHLLHPRRLEDDGLGDFMHERFLEVHQRAEFLDTGVQPCSGADDPIFIFMPLYKDKQTLPL